MPDNDDFPGLLQRVRDGDSEALEQLVEQYHDELLRVARARLGNALRPYLDSCDLVQSVHKSIVLGLRDDKLQLQTPEHLLRLAAMILRRKIAKKWKRHQRQVRLDRSVGQTELTDSCSVSYLILQTDSGYEDPAKLADLQERLTNVLENLDSVDRELVEMRLAGFSTAEAAREMGLSPDVLRARFGRLRKRLQASQINADWV